MILLLNIWKFSTLVTQQHSHSNHSSNDVFSVSPEIMFKNFQTKVLKQLLSELILGFISKYMFYSNCTKYKTICFLKHSRASEA
jgi:hypothetical protein